MLQNPTLRFVLRAVFAGIGGFVTAIQALGTQDGYDNLSSGDWINAAVSGVVLALAFAGVMGATPIDKSVGVGKEETLT